MRLLTIADVYSMITNLPDEIQKEIGAYLDTASLCFFSMTSYYNLDKMRSLLIKRQQTILHSINLSPTAYNSSVCYTPNSIYACGQNTYAKMGLGGINEFLYLTTLRRLVKPPGIIQQVAAGQNHILVLTDQGLYACGDNSFGQLGLGITNKLATSFTLLSKPPGTIQKLVAGAYHTLVLTDEGLYACGHNSEGQLGLGHTNKCMTLTPLKLLPGVVQQIATGAYHTLVLTDEGLYACGRNSEGQLGLGHTNKCMTLTPLKPLPGVVQQIAAGVHHTLVLINQELYVCGSNNSGQLGLGYTNKTITSFMPLANFLGTIQQVVAGAYHTILLTDRGLYVCGHNSEGQLGLGHKHPCNTFKFIDKQPLGIIHQVVAGAYHTLVLTDKGLYVSGRNLEGQLGRGYKCNYPTLTLTRLKLKKVPPELRRLQALQQQLDKLISIRNVDNLISQPVIYKPK